MEFKTLTEKVAYLKGLMEGLKTDDKVIALMADILCDMANEIEDMQCDMEELSEVVDTIDEDLGEVERDFYEIDEDMEAAYEDALTCGTGAVIDCIVGRDEMVNPMVAAGSAITDFLLGEKEDAQ